ncbi:WAP four-disulfide core domain protein 1 [Mizuhopecten yessoensis]|uniref:WAP four-disulfide core domain protein 1 n=1 Tax=Mizuhopecten yessoensis TaxID=6573 RepID=A0A210QD97_MIZYE|nr:WAP four-disulfide core domain protein 1 [Mizuhopecten yessoensis]
MGDAPDSVTNNDNDLCPPIPEVIPTHACKVKSKCESDLDCRKRTARCCYNGCVRTCRRQQDPPAVIDWVKEPRRRLSSGISWLLSGPDIAQELEPCSTTPYTDEEDPLLCPHGYVCHVEDPGDPELDLPNRGHCIPESDDKFARLGVGYVSRRMKDNSCWMDKYVLLDGASMMFKGKTWYRKTEIEKTKYRFFTNVSMVTSEKGKFTQCFNSDCNGELLKSVPNTPL